MKNVKPSAVKWKCGVSSYKDECSITLPLKTYIRNNRNEITDYPKGSAESSIQNDLSKQKTIFTEGDKVDVLLGYNGNNTRRFKGFVKRINYAKPLVLECEGYTYQLKDKMFTKTYSTTTVKQILADLVSGTDILLSDRIPSISLKNVVFKNAPALKVLDWFAKECLLSVFFDFDTIYVGVSKQDLSKPTVNVKIGWNTVEDKELKKDTTESEVHIHLTEKSSTGKVKRTKSESSKYDNIKDVRVRSGLSDSLLTKLANELQKQENFKGYRGTITCFLEPMFEKCYVAKVIDSNYTDRNGFYFTENIEGSFDQNGGRQILTLRYYGS